MYWPAQSGHEGVNPRGREGEVAQD